MTKVFSSILLIISVISLIGCTKSETLDINEGYFQVQCDYGRIKPGEITILIDNCWPFLEFSDYGIYHIYPGDKLYIEYQGNPLIAESYPGQMFGIKVQNVKLDNRIVKKVSESEIERNNNGLIEKIHNNPNEIKYIILDKELNYIALNQYQDEPIYAIYNNKIVDGYESQELVPICFLAFDPNEIN